MYLGDVQQRLIDLARRRVRAGTLTERGLARLCGLSQPHVHNVLKNIRALSPRAADRLMRALGVTTPDLLWSLNDESSFGFRGIPISRNRIGPGSDPSLALYRGVMPFPAALLENRIGSRED